MKVEVKGLLQVGSLREGSSLFLGRSESVVERADQEVSKSEVSVSSFPLGLVGRIVETLKIRAAPQPPILVPPANLFQAFLTIPNLCQFSDWHTLTSANGALAPTNEQVAIAPASVTTPQPSEPELTNGLNGSLDSFSL